MWKRKILKYGHHKTRNKKGGISLISSKEVSGKILENQENVQ